MMRDYLNVYLSNVTSTFHGLKIYKRLYMSKCTINLVVAIKMNYSTTLGSSPQVT